MNLLSLSLSHTTSIPPSSLKCRMKRLQRLEDFRCDVYGRPGNVTHTNSQEDIGLAMKPHNALRLPHCRAAQSIAWHDIRHSFEGECSERRIHSVFLCIYCYGESVSMGCDPKSVHEPNLYQDLVAKYDNILRRADTQRSQHLLSRARCADARKRSISTKRPGLSFLMTMVCVTAK